MCLCVFVCDLANIVNNTDMKIDSAYIYTALMFTHAVCAASNTFSSTLRFKNELQFAQCEKQEAMKTKNIVEN